MNELYFDEIKMQESLQNAILDFYKTDSRHEKDYWYKLFGNRNLKFYSSQTEANSQGQKPQFPCIILSIDSEPDTTWINSSQIEEVSRVNLTIELYTMQVNNIDKILLCKYLSEIVILGIRNLSSNIVLTRSTPIPNIDNNICRRIIRGTFKYDNKTNTFSQGD